MAFTKLTKDMNIIQKLDDEPNDVGGLTAAQLKAKFDEPANAVKDWINNTFIPEAEQTLRDARLESLPEHAHLHAADGDDPITPAEIGAVSVAIGNSFTQEILYGDHDFLQSLDATMPAIPHASNFTHYVTFDSTGKVRGAVSVPLDYAGEIYCYISQTGVWQRLATTDSALLKAEKPSGYYTGNGDAVARTVDTQGAGSVCVIYDSTGTSMVICTPAGAIYKNSGSGVVGYFDSSAIRFSEGALTVATADSVVNYNGGAYFYQVL